MAAKRPLANYSGTIKELATGDGLEGTWQGTAIASGYGGTGFTTYAKGDIIYASGVDTLAKLPAGTDGQVLTLSGGVPTWAAGGIQTVYLPASSLLPTITNGATPVYRETSTNKNIISGLAFDAATQEHAQFSIVMPKSWDRGTVTAKFDWTHGATTTDFGVTWALQAVAVGNDDALDVAFGTEQIIADVGGTTDDLYITASTPALTIAGTPAEGDRVNFQVYRDVADAGDTMAVDAVLLGITLFYGTVSNSDA